MFKHRIDDSVSLKVYFDWFTLSFLAGNINAGGLLSCGRFVSHVTGFATLAGISLKEGSLFETISVLSIPIYFLIGVVISGFLTEGRRQNENKNYSLIMGLVAICLGVTTLAGYYQHFGAFGEPANILNDYFLLALLCGACGLQNAAITTASGYTMRTTHLTGLTTDLGLGLVKAYINKKRKNLVRNETRVNALRVLTIFSFLMGSFIGSIFYSKFQYLGFALPTLLAIYASVQAHFSK